MKLWPFGDKLETRAESSFTDVLVAALVSRAQGKSLAVPSATAALEACAGTVGRGFAASEVTGPASLARALTPGCLELVGRSLIQRGEVVFLIDTQAGNLRLIPAETHDVEGGPYPEEWEYTLTLGGPSKTVTHDFVPAASVLHFRYAVDASTPWRGNGPIAVANLAGRLSAETVSALANESSGPVGRLLGIPVDGEDATVQALKSDIANAKGKVALLESGDLGQRRRGRQGGPQGRAFRGRAAGGSGGAGVSGVPGSVRGVRIQCGFVGRLPGGKCA